MTAELIAEARTMGTEDRAQVVAMLDRLADALEVAIKEPKTVTCLECEGEGAFNVTFVYGNQHVRCEYCGGTGRVPVDAARVVSTVAELDALPGGSVVLSEQGAVWMFLTVRPGWYEPGSATMHYTDDIALPATVLWVGGTE